RLIGPNPGNEAANFRCANIESSDEATARTHWRSPRLCLTIVFYGRCHYLTFGCNKVSSIAVMCSSLLGVFSSILFALSQVRGLPAEQVDPVDVNQSPELPVSRWRSIAPVEQVVTKRLPSRPREGAHQSHYLCANSSDDRLRGPRQSRAPRDRDCFR